MTIGKISGSKDSDFVIENGVLTKYTGSGGDTPLLAEAPYDEMYIHYLSAQIDYANCEYDRFNNSNAMFESAYSAFRNAYNRDHTAKQRKKKYW